MLNKIFPKTHINEPSCEDLVGCISPFQDVRGLIIGGGAAGFFCAINAAINNPNLQITILEKSSKVLQKVKISGGGRCNVTHACFSIAEMVKKYPRGEKLLKKLFHQFFTTDTIKWFDERGVQLKAEDDGRMFPITDSSQTIIDCLVNEAHKLNIQLLLNKDVTELEKSENKFKITCRNGEVFNADYVCITSGGFPKAEQYNWITKHTGHTIAAPVPSLFTFNIPKHAITQLMGVATNAQVKIAGLKQVIQGPVLITHWGLSGPAVLRLSAFAAIELQQNNYEFTVLINWLPEYNENSLRDHILTYRNTKHNQKIINSDWLQIPNRLAAFLLTQCGIDADCTWGNLPGANQNKLIKTICAYELQAKGKTTYKEEFVTAGGINLTEIDSNTLMSKKVENLYFAGEILNVDGITGGFNFQNAWTTGFVVAKALTPIP